MPLQREAGFGHSCPLHRRLLRRREECPRLARSPQPSTPPNLVPAPLREAGSHHRCLSHRLSPRRRAGVSRSPRVVPLPRNAAGSHPICPAYGIRNRRQGNAEPLPRQPASRSQDAPSRRNTIRIPCPAARPTCRRPGGQQETYSRASVDLFSTIPCRNGSKHPQSLQDSDASGNPFFSLARPVNIVCLRWLGISIRARRAKPPSAGTRKRTWTRCSRWSAATTARGSIFSNVRCNELPGHPSLPHRDQGACAPLPATRCQDSIHRGSIHHPGDAAKRTSRAAESTLSNASAVVTGRVMSVLDLASGSL